MVADAGRSTIFNPGPHGFSEVLSAFSSAGNNNGSAFAGLGANNPFYIRLRNRPDGSHLSRVRWPVERTFNWIKCLRRMRIRYDRHPTLIDAWNNLSIAAICFRILHPAS